MSGASSVSGCECQPCEWDCVSVTSCEMILVSGERLEEIGAWLSKPRISYVEFSILYQQNFHPVFRDIKNDGTFRRQMS